MSLFSSQPDPPGPQDLTLRALIHSLPDQFFRFRCDGTVLDLVLNGVGSPLDPAQTVGSRIQDSSLPEDIRHAYMRGILMALASGEVQTLTYGLPLEGREAFREVRLFPCADDEVVALVRDITERTLAERERLKLLQAVEQSPVLIMITDTEGRIEYVNPKFTEITGYGLEEVLGRKPSMLKSGEMPAQAYRELWSTLHAGGVWRGEFHNVNKWGQLYWESATIAPLQDASGKPSKFIGFKEDITERKKVQAALLRATHLMRAMLSSLHAGILLVGTDHRVQVVNEAYCRLFDLEERPESLLGLTAVQMFALCLPSFEDPDAEERRLQGHMASGQTVFGEEVRLTQGRTHLRDFQPLVVDGHLQGWLWHQQDITPLKQVEQALRETSKRESLWLMAGGIAHDFNNLFQAILGNLEVAKVGVDPASMGGRALDRGLGLLEKASALAQNMLEYAGKSPHQIEAVNLNLLIQGYLATLGDRARGIKLDLEPMLPAAAGDPHQVHRILEGLLNNALEAQAERPGQVVVRTSSIPLSDQERREGFWVEPAPDHVMIRLWVSDAGGGIPEDALGRIFDPFFTTKSPGRGLGLPAILGITRAHGGGLQVLNRPGRGTTIQLCLPPYAVSDAALQDERSASFRTGSGVHGILLVDDEEDLRTTLVEALTEIYGYRIFEARDGLEGLEVFNANRDDIDLAVMDVLMPRMKGPEAFAAMKAAKPSLRGILISGFSDESGHQLASTYNFQAFLKKPFGLAALAAAVEKALGMRK